MGNIFENIVEKKQVRILKMLSAHLLKLGNDYDFYSMVNTNNLVCYIRSGSVEIIKEDYYGNKFVLKKLSAGDTFISNVSYGLNDEYKIIATSESKVFVFDYSNVFNSDFIKYDYFVTFLSNLLEIIKDETKEKIDRIEILTKRSLRDKLMEYFKIESKILKRKSYKLPMSFTDLADYLAVDRSAMTREIKNLKDDGFLVIENKRVTIMY